MGREELDQNILDCIHALLDKQAIAELIHGYCRAADRRDVTAIQALYHPDALDDHGDYYRGSAEGYFEILPALMAPVITMQHHVTTMNIRLDGDAAEAETYVLAIHQLRGENGPADHVVGTRFTDKFEKRGGAWKFTHRAHVMDWQLGNTPSAISAIRDGLDGAADPAYGFFRLFRRGE
jgi:ketosteroid isomerase-like protein